jgi:hypothetical protein
MPQSNSSDASLLGRPLSTATPATNSIYKFDGHLWVPTAAAGIDSTAIHSGDSAAGVAGVDNLVGTYPSPTVPGFGTWTGYTPSLTQSGDLAPTVNQARWIQIGHLVIVQFKLTTVNAGTSGVGVFIGGPTTTAVKVIANQGVGSAQINGFGSGNYGCVLIRYNSGTTAPKFDFMRADVNTVSGVMGVDPASTIGVGAILQGTFQYEVT